MKGWDHYSNSVESFVHPCSLSNKKCLKCKTIFFNLEKRLKATKLMKKNELDKMA